MFHAQFRTSRRCRFRHLRALLVLAAAYLLPEYLVVRAGSLKKRNPVAFAPDDKPVSSIGYVTFVAPTPCALKTVHVVASCQLFARLGRVFDNGADDGM